MFSTECKFCKGVTSNLCQARSTDRYNCTRLAGHKGPHVACGTTSHCMAKWKQEPKKKEVSNANPRI